MKKSFSVFKEGIRDGLPIGFGYLAVSFSLGIAAREAGMNAIEGFVLSLSVIASAGEYAGITGIAQQISYIEMGLVLLIANARYFLMSCSLSQRLDPKTGNANRIGVGCFLTDEIFGVTIARRGYIEPIYVYGVALGCVPLWAIGTALGIISGNVLPARIVSALAVSLYAMFLAIIIPPAKKDKAVAAIIVVSFAASFICTKIPALSGISDGTKIIILTIIIAAAAAVIAPRKELQNE